MRTLDAGAWRRRWGAEGGRAQRGFIVVAVLWMLAALAVLASVASVYVAQSAVALSINEESLQADALITAGLELTTYQVSALAAHQRPTRGAFQLRLAGAEVAVEYRSEAARVDLNAAPKPLIAGLFQVLGASAETADAYADRVVGWRSPPKRDGPDDEEALYRAAGLTYAPRRAPFAHVQELWLVLGLPPALVERALPFVTIYSGIAEINVLDAAPEVIAALPGMTPARLDAFLGQRQSLAADPRFAASAFFDRQAGVTFEGSQAYRVRMRITLPDGRTRTPEIVIFDGIFGPYSVLSWQDDLDFATGRPRRMAEAR